LANYNRQWMAVNGWGMYFRCNGNYTMQSNLDSQVLWRKLTEENILSTLLSASEKNIMIHTLVMIYIHDCSYINIYFNIYSI